MVHHDPEYSLAAMKPMPRIRRRIQKTVAFALHATRSIASRRKLDEFTASSPTVRALLAAADDRFSSDERRAFAVIEREREKLYARRDDYMWSIENAADPRSAPPPERHIVGDSAQKASTKPHWGRFLYALVREIKPDMCLELGCCFGMSGQYILAAMRHVGRGKLLTMEGSRARAEISAERFRALGHENFEIEIGDFDRTLAPFIEKAGRIDLTFVDGNHRREPTVRYDALVRRHMHAGGVIVHDDIRWSSEMEDAWAEIAARPARLVFDVFRMGLVELGDGRKESVCAWLGLDQLR